MNGALRGALATLHPGRADTLLLRACLADGDDCRSAWTAFTGDGRDLVQLFRTDRGELKRLGPLLGWNLQRNQAPHT